MQSVPSDPVNLARLPTAYHGEKLPILRAKGHMTCVDEMTPSTIKGPEWADENEHDAGQWVQSEENAIRLADAIQSWVTTPMVALRGVSIHPDPRLELGDVVVIEDAHVYDRSIRALIVGINVSGASGALEMTLDVQVLDSAGLERTH